MRAWLPCSALLVLLCGCSTSAPDLQCPSPESGQAQGSLKETPQQIAAAGQRLGRGSENEIDEVVAGLRSSHPDASSGEIINYLVTAYCPRVKADPSLSSAGKQNVLNSFSGRLEKIVGPH